MKERMIAMYVAVQTAVFNFKNREKGAVDIVAIVILIAVAIGLAILFKDKLTELLGNWFSKIGEKGQNAITD